MQRILVATDFSAASRRALMHAARMAHAAGAELRVVHVAEPGEDPPEGTIGWDLAPGPAHERLHGQVQRLVPADQAVTAFIREGRPVEVILAEAAAPAADLIVMGASGVSGWRRPSLGSTVRRVLERAPCPVLVVHDGDPVRAQDPRRILVATDFSASARAALHCAVGLFAISAADTLVLAHAFHLSPAVSLAVSPFNRVELEGLVRQEAVRQLEEEAKPLHVMGLTPAQQVLEGLAVEALVRAAGDIHADLVVAGTLGRTGLAHLLLGSTAERLVERAPCPVLVVPPAAVLPAATNVDEELEPAIAGTTPGDPEC
jgi:nucleotide-binding universal stress UspA family protein